MDDISVAHPPPLAARFDLASETILDFLRDAVPMGLWTVTRVVDNRQTYLTVNGTGFGPIPAGISVPWDAALCKYMIEGEPHVAPDVREVPAYFAVTEADGGRVAAYIGYPLITSDGHLFGTLCAFAPTAQPADFIRHGPLVELLARLLSTIIESDLEKTALHRELEVAEQRAATDGLTGLMNRAAWDVVLDREERRYQRFGDSCAIICIDLDGLKSVNDTLGHPAGDDYLRRAAKTLGEQLRDTDIIARVGGDEFGIIVPNADPVAAAELVERLSVALDRAEVLASIGHAQYSMTDGFAGAWNSADKAMYERKRTRRSLEPSLQNE
ncbi:GGDEF domain-containing protein [Antrihabitans cavernicola]|uniref:Sensor domain-containing diguanylate cyclase n=1 Tax=Antrihabitans cavernicola TaxID=2495913 RepID=A0A5A7S440_9NOCA|nr:sensor domain-containing diguanylate cyclase [Spelaeibacter cavernicola]KAA0020171.1 sensor domain-containing diguanylate cyclase [Spelaeibacter cavernicola]